MGPRTDRIFASFLTRQLDEAAELNRESHLVRLLPLPSTPDAPPARYLVRYGCKGLVELRPGVVEVAEEFYACVDFPLEYVRRADPVQVLAWLEPVNIFHPNIRPPFICIGRLAPATPLVEIVERVHELITLNRFTAREDDALSHPACVWVRRNLSRLPIDARPLRRRSLSFELAPENIGSIAVCVEGAASSAPPPAPPAATKRRPPFWPSGDDRRRRYDR